MANVGIRTKEIVTLDPVEGTYSAYQAGNSLDFTYVHIVTTDGYETYIQASWTPDQISAEISSILAARTAKQTEDLAASAALQSMVEKL